MNKVAKKRSFHVSKGVACEASGVAAENSLKVVRTIITSPQELSSLCQAAGGSASLIAAAPVFTWFHTRQGRLLHFKSKTAWLGPCSHTKQTVPFKEHCFLGVEAVVASGRALCPVCWGRVSEEIRVVARTHLGAGMIPALRKEAQLSLAA